MAIARDDPWHYNASSDRYVHIVTGEELTAAQLAARQAEVAAWSAASAKSPPPIPATIKTHVAVVELPAALAVLTEIGKLYYTDNVDVNRYAAHVADRLRNLVKTPDLKELLR